MNAQDKKLFKEFLKLNKCYKRFKKMYNKYSYERFNLRIYLNRIPTSRIILCAFPWEKDKNNRSYWENLHNKWRIHLIYYYE